MRLIDADELKPDMKIFTSAYSTDLTECYSLKAVNNATTVEAEPLKHGEWRISKSGGLPTNKFVCSECNGLTIVSTFRNKCLYNYCPHCGAKMTEAVNEATY